MFGLWSFLRQFMYTKFIVVTDDDVDIRDWKDVVWAITTRMDPVRDTTLVDHTPIDYLDFASPVSGLGGKMGLDATNKWPGETDARMGPADPHGPASRRAETLLGDGVAASAERPRIPAPCRRACSAGRSPNVASLHAGTPRRSRCVEEPRPRSPELQTVAQPPTLPPKSGGVRFSGPAATLAAPALLGFGRGLLQPFRHADQDAARPAPRSCRASPAPRACRSRRPSRSIVCACAISCSTVCAGLRAGVAALHLHRVERALPRPPAAARPPGSPW